MLTPVITSVVVRAPFNVPQATNSQINTQALSSARTEKIIPLFDSDG